jgi:hypothetical protein
MRGRRLGAVALAVACIVLWAEAGVAAPARGSVKVRRVRWAGLQMNIAGVSTGGHFVVKPAQAKGSVTSLAPVAGICGGCVVAINGDFFDFASRQPVGGVIINGIVLRSPNPRQNQLTIGPAGRISAGYLHWTGRLVLGGLHLPVAVNDPRATTPVIYTPRFGTTTPPGAGIELRFVPHPSRALRIGKKMRLEFRGTHQPGTAFGASEVVLRATGPYATTLRQLLADRRAKPLRPTLRLRTDPTAENSLGANHILLRDGQRVPIDEHDYFADGPNPRTIFAWNDRSHVKLITIGSAIPGHRAGVSLPVAARLVQKLGMRNAVNLDGGGSSTFVSHGRVRNHPSDGRARAVSNAWVVVPHRARHRTARKTRTPRAARSIHGHARQRVVHDAPHDPAGLTQQVRVAPSSGEHEPTLERGDRRDRQRSCVVGRDARRGKSGRGRVDPARKHLLGRDPQRLVGARHLARHRPDRARVDEVGLREHRRRAVEEVGHCRTRARRLVGDRLEQLPVRAPRRRDHRRGELVLPAREEVVERPGRRPRR